MAKFKSIYEPVHDRARVTWSFLTIIPLAIQFVLSFLLAVGVVIAGGYATGGIASPEGIGDYVSGAFGDGGPFFMALPFAFMIILSTFWTRIVENRSLGSMGFGMRLWLWRYLAGFVTGAVFLFAVLGLIYLGGGYKIEAVLPAMAAPDPMSAGLLLAAYLVAFMVQGAGEETVFRGWWMSALASRRGKTLALIATSVVFALAHMGNVNPPTVESMTGVANIVLFGLYIGLYAMKEGSLWGACGWHSAWNWLLGLGFGLEVSGQGVEATPMLLDLADAGGTSLLTGGGFGPEASLVTTAVLLVGCWWLVMRGALRTKDDA